MRIKCLSVWNNHLGSIQRAETVMVFYSVRMKPQVGPSPSFLRPFRGRLVSGRSSKRPGFRHFSRHYTLPAERERTDQSTRSEPVPDSQRESERLKMSKRGGTR